MSDRGSWSCIQHRHIPRRGSDYYVPSRPGRIVLQVSRDQPCACRLCQGEKTRIIRIWQWMRPQSFIGEAQCAFNQELQPRRRKVKLREFGILRDSPVFRDDGRAHRDLDGRLLNDIPNDLGRKALWLNPRRHNHIRVENDQSHRELLRFDFCCLCLRISPSISSSETWSNS